MRRLLFWVVIGVPLLLITAEGGAELVSEEEAQAAIQRGEQIAVDDVADRGQRKSCPCTR